MKAANNKTGNLKPPEKSYVQQMISVIVPLRGKVTYVQDLLRFIKKNCHLDCLQEIIFIDTTESEQPLKLQHEKKVRILYFKGASYSKSIEVGAFEATGDILFFLKPGTFPVSNFGTTILASIKTAVGAGILKQTLPDGLVQRLKWLLPLRVILFFMKADNLFITKQLFYLKTKHVPRKEFSSFGSFIKIYAVIFKAKLIMGY